MKDVIKRNDVVGLLHALNCKKNVHRIKLNDDILVGT